MAQVEQLLPEYGECCLRRQASIEQEWEFQDVLKCHACYVARIVMMMHIVDRMNVEDRHCGVCKSDLRFLCLVWRWSKHLSTLQQHTS